MIKPTFTVDTREFDRTLNEYINLRVKKSIDWLINFKAFRIALKAEDYTRRADYQKMANELGVKLRTVQKGKRKGKLTMR